MSQGEQTLEERALVHALAAVPSLATAAFDTELRYVQLNDAARAAAGHQLDDAIGRTVHAVLAPQQAAALAERLQATLDSGTPSVHVIGDLPSDPVVGRVWRSHYAPVRGDDGAIVGVLVVGDDITEQATSTQDAEQLLNEQRRFQRLLESQRDIAEQIAAGDTLQEVLTSLVGLIEQQSNDPVRASVLLYDAERNVLRHGAAPSLPAAYNAAIDGIEVGPNVGSCGTAVHTGEVTVVVDIQTDGRWADFRELAAEHGLRACWSVPIHSDTGVLGTVAVYHDEPATPSDADLAAAQLFARAAGTAIERTTARDRADREGRIVETLYEVSQSISRRRDLAEIVQVVTDSVTQLTGAQFGAFFYNVTATTGEQYVLYTISGVPRSEFDKFPMPRNTAIFNPTFQGERIVRSDDITQHPDYGHSAPHHGMPEGHLPVRSYLAVPVVLSEGEVAGGLFLGHGEPARFTDEHERIVTGIASQAAIAMETVQLLERERRAREGAEHRARAAVSLEYVGDGVFLLDEDGVVRVWNPAAERVTGICASDLLGARMVDAVPGWAAIHNEVPVATVGDDAPTLPRMLPLALESGERWISAHGVAFDGGTVYAFRDASDDRRLEEIRTEMIATVSHELRTPIAAVYGAAQTIQRPDIHLDEDIRGKLMDVITSESSRLARLVSDILQASSLGAHGTFGAEPIDVAQVAREVVEDFPDDLTGGAAVEFDAGGDLPLARGDHDRLRQVLVNLIDNGVKYGGTGGRVRVSVQADGDGVRCDVRDWGQGIPQAEHARIFERFYRLDPNQAHGVGGTGLGLYICREIVTRMGGRIWVDSPEGGGARFSVRLPGAGRSASS